MGKDAGGDEGKSLEEAQKVVQQEAFLMKRALDSKNLREALKHSAVMISELRTPLLSPKNYYGLYMSVLDELVHMESFFRDMLSTGKRMADLYELVQHAGNILPRMYLLITVGSVFIESKESACKDILKDLVEMCRGVQHPMRGLFLRNYLSQMSKNKLPDEGSEYEGDGGTTRDAIDFIIMNFTEMNKLWVRMSMQGPIRDRDKRERERRDLRVLVGTCLVRLSQLEGVTTEMYKSTVLPRVLEQITNCKDAIAQEYLMDCVIQVFPDQMHIATLETFLNTCTQLQAQVNVKSIMCSLMDRLANFATSCNEPGGGGFQCEIKAFNIFTQYIAKVIQQNSGLELKDILELQVSLVNFALQAYPERQAYVDHVLKFCGQFIEKKIKNDAMPTDCALLVERLLTTPLRTYKSILDVLELQHYASLLGSLELEERTSVAVNVVRNMTKNQTPLVDGAQFERLLELMQPLLEEQDEDATLADDDLEEFVEQQRMVARMVHLVTCEEVDLQFQLLLLLRKHLGMAGQKRLCFTMPSLLMAALKLAVKVRSMERTTPKDERQFAIKSKEVLNFVHQILEKALKPSMPELSFKFYMSAAQASNVCGYRGITYEFLSQAYQLYEREISDSQAQIDAITMMVGIVQSCRCLNEDEYDAFSTKTTLYASKLIRKPDQTRMLALCSKLFWSPDNTNSGLNLLLQNQDITIRQGKRAVEALRRGVKVASECETNFENVPLYVELLNVYLHHFQMQNDEIEVKWINALISLLQDNIAALQQADPDHPSISHYTRTREFIQQQMEVDSRYTEIELNP